MAETLTYDPGTDSTVLTTDEQESLEVGEKLVEAQEGLLAGKYKNAEELEQGYIELQKKLGDDKPEVAEAETETEAPPSTEVNEQVALINDASTEYADKGELSQETLAKFSEMSSKDLVQAYMEASKNAPQTEVADLSTSDINTIQNSVGGEKAYGDVLTWGVNNLPKSTMDSFDDLVGSGNAKAIELAVAGLKAQMDNADGYEGRMLSGKSPKASGDTFRSQSELVAAMNDPRYENDPAYRQDVLAKLDRSDNLEF